jgi:KipI family sensor histidine kinase inhibitor
MKTLMQDGYFEQARFRTAGDCGLLVEYGDVIDPAVNNKVRSMAIVMEDDRPRGVIEIIPTYRSLLIIYDPAMTHPDRIKTALEEMETRLGDIHIPPPRTVEIPVCYGGDFGPDIDTVADTNQLTVAEVIKLHSQPEYPIYMVGFTPGFPFLGGLCEKLHTPRLETPRTLVPEGSVGIAKNQTGIYPIASPGGWQLIGRTPLKLFAPWRNNPFLYQAGDRLKFVSITAEKFARIAEEEAQS